MKNYKNMNIGDILTSIENSFFIAEGSHEKIVKQNIKFKQLKRSQFCTKISIIKEPSFSVDSSLFGFKNLKDKYL